MVGRPPPAVASHLLAAGSGYARQVPAQPDQRRDRRSGRRRGATPLPPRGSGEWCALTRTLGSCVLPVPAAPRPDRLVQLRPEKFCPPLPGPNGGLEREPGGGLRRGLSERGVFSWILRRLTLA